MAQFGDAERDSVRDVQAVSGKVDFLFVSTTAARWRPRRPPPDAATAMAAKLNNSTLDWRIAIVTTGYPDATNAYPDAQVLRPFTKTIALELAHLERQLHQRRHPVWERRSVQRHSHPGQSDVSRRNGVEQVPPGVRRRRSTPSLRGRR